MEYFYNDMYLMYSCFLHLFQISSCVPFCIKLHIKFDYYLFNHVYSSLYISFTVVINIHNSFSLLQVTANLKTPLVRISSKWTELIHDFLVFSKR